MFLSYPLLCSPSAAQLDWARVQSIRMRREVAIGKFLRASADRVVNGQDRWERSIDRGLLQKLGIRSAKGQLGNAGKGAIVGGGIGALVPGLTTIHRLP